MKALIDPVYNTIHGVYLEPLVFDISGHYCIDIPGLIGGVNPGSDNSPTDLIAAKNAAWQGYSTFSPAPFFYDELITNPNVDLANSTGVELAPYKRTLVHPGGILLTNPISITPGTYPSVFFHYFGFILYREAVDLTNPTNPTPGPSKMLYCYNPNSAKFETFSPSTFTVAICQSTGPFTNISVLRPDVLGASSVTFPSTFRLKFTNISTLPYHLSDWILIYET